MNTKEKILTEAVKLFAREGFDAVTVEMIAAAVGIKAPSLYKHFRSKRDIFEAILKEMERRDAENARKSEMPLEPLNAMDTAESRQPLAYYELELAKDAGDAADTGRTAEEIAEEYKAVDIPSFLDYCRKMFRYWTEDEFASSFRRMLTVEQYKSAEMSGLYHQYLGTGPLGYTADIVGSEEAALALYGPMYMLYSVFDSASVKYTSDAGSAIYDMLDVHLKSWYAKYHSE